MEGSASNAANRSGDDNETLTQALPSPMASHRDSLLRSISQIRSLAGSLSRKISELCGIGNERDSKRSRPLEVPESSSPVGSRRHSVERGSLSPRPKPDKNDDHSGRVSGGTSPASSKSISMQEALLPTASSASVSSLSRSPSQGSFRRPTAMPSQTILSPIVATALLQDLLSLVESLHVYLFQTSDVSLKRSPAAVETTGSPSSADESRERVVKLLKEQADALHALRVEIDVERGVSKVLRQENAELRRGAVKMHTLTEAEEEAMTNKLLTVVRNLYREKAQLLQDVEREEEYLTNSLQRKLLKLQREKVDMENQLETEQEFMVNRLQKQLEAAMSGASLSEQKGTGQKAAEMATESQKQQLDVLTAEVMGLKAKISEMQREDNRKSEVLKAWRHELLVLRQKEGISIEDLFTQDQ